MPTMPINIIVIALLALCASIPTLANELVFTENYAARFVLVTPTERAIVNSEGVPTGETLPLNPDDIAYYEISWACDASGSGQLRVYYPDESTALPDPLLGQCTATVLTMDTDNVSSEPSDVLHFTVRLNRPQRGGLR